MAALKSTTLRDFGGGLNVVDDDLNLSAEFQPVLDNVHRGVDNTLSVRWGTELFVDLRRGSVWRSTTTFTTNWTLNQREIICTWNGHGLVNGDHITFHSGWTNMLGLRQADMIGHPFGVRVISANEFRIVAKWPHGATSSDTGAKDVTKDTHYLAGDLLEIIYYNDHLVVFDTSGEAVKINAAMTVTKIWDYAKAFDIVVNSGSASQAGGPGWTTPIDYVSTCIFKGKLIAVNGVDKPLEIAFDKTPNANYLADAGNNYSIQHVPVCRYVCAIDRWVIMAGDPLMPYKVHISATDSHGTWQNPSDEADNDGTGLELNNTNSSSLYVRGVNKFRNFLAVAFDDTVAMVELGIFDELKHRPETTDSVARHGSVAHKSMVFLGFDLVMADPIGIPSFAKSQFDTSIIPSRMSEFVAPMLQRNISALTAQTLERDIFSVYSTHDSRYVLFVPNHDGVAVKLTNNPIYYLRELVGTNRALLRVNNHRFEEGDRFSFSGLIPRPGKGSITELYTECIVDTIVNNNVISFMTAEVIDYDLSWGGANASLTYLRTETTAYALTYNKNLKIKAWSRYKGWDFRAGCTTLYGRVFLAGQKGKIWRMGNRFDPIYADYVGQYDASWANSKPYTVGQKIKDGDTGESYTCEAAHTSHASGTFEQDRIRWPFNWKYYKGTPIKFAFEFPWADFDKRDLTKIIKTINVDAKGIDHFKVQMFIDYYYKHKTTGIRTPQLSMDMVGGDEGAYGVLDQHYGTGRMAIRQRPLPYEARGKLFKFRVEGATVEPLRFVAFIFGYKIVGRDR
jgi:hypothetical protein